MTRLRVLALALLAAIVITGVARWEAEAQTPPTLLPPATTAPPATETTTTTAPPADTTTSTVPAEGPAPGSGATPEEGGDGGDGSNGGRLVPPEAQQYISSIRRSGANDDESLVRGAQDLLARGMSDVDVVRHAYGRFPVAGYARWSDDWLYPRWTGTTFRYHLGCDVLAAYGTPLRAVVDGVVRISTSELGGLSVKVHQPDGTFFYYAHLSAIPEGLVDGQPVATGDVVGFVGDSGNARGGPPHVHFAVHPFGGDPAPPKPYLDQWVIEAEARLPELLGLVDATRPRPLVATALVRQLAADATIGDPMSSAPASTELLFASSANPVGGVLRLAEASADAVARSVDWEGRAVEQQAFVLAWDQAATRARGVLDPLMPAALRDAARARANAARPSS